MTGYEPFLYPTPFRQQSCIVVLCRANWATDAVFRPLKSISYIIIRAFNQLVTGSTNSPPGRV